MLAFIICKNEEPNIERCIRALQAAQLQPVLIDSGSTDRTLDIARRLGAQIRPHVYESHCRTYNDLISALPATESCVVVDADMIVSRGLAIELRDALREGADVVRAPVKMVWAGYSLRHASLYPPKAIAFRGGGKYFEPFGHGEQVISNVKAADVEMLLVHDDRKPYPSFLASQVRYGRAIRKRLQKGEVSWKDRVRSLTPFVVLAQPLVSYVWKGGFRDGRGGALYALDRLIAEAILFREALAEADDDTPGQ
jgi:glycosyltransferase involved in cell wall biosynthesis